MGNFNNKPRLNHAISDARIKGECKRDGKWGYFISLCNQQTPYSQAEDFIKIEYPKNGTYGYEMIRPDSTINTIVLFIFRDFPKRTVDLEEIAIFGYSAKGKEHIEKHGDGWCLYKCEHKPFPKLQYNKIIVEFNKLKYCLKTGKAKSITDYLRKNIISD